ncbi:hypothetical protein RHGRI_010912 [Rhododendron griersonianum]|uniref:Uncharacterized protein n=1 Tax=Rhododendron griersonianum TaxID=479676 RepID=A0AAV6KKK1_9ERIC|nr:hypothetical protein RHGRI_010912 [Rhododendron griersonianum]
MPKRWSRQGVAEAWQADCLSSGKAMHCPRHAKTKGGQGMTHGMPKEGVAKAWQADCMSPGKAMHCSRHAKTHGMPKEGVAKAWQADCMSPGKEMHCSRHAKTKGGQGMTGMASRLLVTGQANALLTACQKKGWPRHAKPIACHRARQCIAHDMPKEGVAKAWQADCMSPGKAMHCSRHAKTKGGQGMTGMASRLLVTGQANALLWGWNGIPRGGSQSTRGLDTRQGGRRSIPSITTIGVKAQTMGQSQNPISSTGLVFHHRRSAR